MFRPSLHPIVAEVTIREKELQRLASMASKQYERPVIFVFDTGSSWVDQADMLSKVTSHPKEIFLPNPHQRFTVGYCSWLLCEFSVFKFPKSAEDILSPSEPGRVKMINFFDAHGKQCLSAGNIFMIEGYIS